MFGHLYRILWNLRSLADWLLQYFHIDFRFIRFNPNGHRENFQKICPFQTSMYTVFIYKYTHFSLIYFIQNISSYLKSLHSGVFIARKMILIFFVLCAILIFAYMYGLFIGNLLLKNLRLMSVYISMRFFSL